MTDLVASRRPFIDGGVGRRRRRPAAPSSRPPPVRSIAEVETTSPEQFTAAIAAARRAFDEGPWPTLDPAERVAAVRRFGAALESRRSVLSDTVVAEAGCPRMVTDWAQVGHGPHQHPGDRRPLRADAAVGAQRGAARRARRRLHRAALHPALRGRRRRRGDQPLQLPVHHQHLEGRPRAAHRLHGRAAAQPAHAARGLSCSARPPRRPACRPAC